MTLYVDVIKYVLFAIILIVFSVKIWQETQKIVKRFKKKDDTDLDFKEVI